MRASSTSSAHGVPRATGDLDILVRPTIENAHRVLHALRLFGAPVDAHGIRETDAPVRRVGHAVPPLWKVPESDAHREPQVMIRDQSVFRMSCSTSSFPTAAAI